jgi:hypothetical protein
MHKEEFSSVSQRIFMCHSRGKGSTERAFPDIVLGAEWAFASRFHGRKGRRANGSSSDDDDDDDEKGKLIFCLYP